MHKDPPMGAIPSPQLGYLPYMGAHMGAQMGPASPEFQGYPHMSSGPDPYGHYDAAPMIGTTTYNPYSHVPGQMGNYNPAMVASPARSYSTTFSPITNPSAMVYNNNESQGESSHSRVLLQFPEFTSHKILSHHYDFFS